MITYRNSDEMVGLSVSNTSIRLMLRLVVSKTMSAVCGAAALIGEGIK